MQAFVITAYKDYQALKTLTLALSQRGLCVIHADARGAITPQQVEELNALLNLDHKESEIADAEPDEAPRPRERPAAQMER